MMEYADPDDVAKALQDMPAEYLLCRGGGRHNYTKPVDAKWYGKYRFWEVIRACQCGVRQIQEINQRGYLISSRPDYSEAPGYLLKGIGRIDGDGRAVARLEMLERAIPVTKVRGGDGPHPTAKTKHLVED